jgi:hypothetical protein
VSNDPNSDAILAAIRRAGISIPGAEPIVLSASSPSIRRFWLVSNGQFSTVVDWRDASSVEEALKVAREDGTQAWYVSELHDTLLVKEISRNEYIDWLRRGVR